MAYSVQFHSERFDKKMLIAVWAKKNERPEAVLEKRYQALYGQHAYEKIITAILFHDSTVYPVGCSSLLSRIFFYNGMRIKAGINCDIFVDLEHRTLGPAIMLLKSLVLEANKAGFQMLIVIPNDKAEPVFARLGYKHIGFVFRWIKLLKTEKKVSGLTRNALVNKLLSKILDIFLYFFSMELWYRIYFLFTNQPFETKEIFFNELPDRFKSQETIEMDSPALYLKWRYTEVQSNNSRIFAIERMGKIEGALIYQINDKNAYISDYFSNNKKARIDTRLLCDFILLMRKQRVDTISSAFFGEGHLFRDFKKFGFMRREKRSVFFHPIDPSIESMFKGDTNFSLMETDLDL